MSLVLLLALGGSYAAAADPESFDTAISKKAASIHALLKKKGYTNVGVLKFLVKQGDGKLSDDAGDLNLTLANKLETALVLANLDEKFGIIDRASEAVVKEKLTAANHRSDDGRKAFFTRQYELGWSRDKVTPAAFLTAVVAISPDLKTMTVQLQLFDATGKLEDLPDALAVATDPEMLAQAGFSYSVPKATQKALVSGKAPPAAKMKEEAVETMKQQAAAPVVPEKEEVFAPLADSPIQLTIMYNDEPVKVKNGVVPEPKASDRISFKIVNPGPGTYAAVLLVNGQNTLYNETLTPLACRKWVLEPGMEVTIRGFQTDADNAAPFRVTKTDEPVEDAVRYGPHAGTFRFVVFSGTMSATEPVKKEMNTDLANQLAMANTRGTPVPNVGKPQSLKALQRDLRGRAADDKGSRGYVVKGANTEKSETTSVYFAPNSETPVTDASVKYITPKN
jgi:hypothetical protein